MKRLYLYIFILFLIAVGVFIALPSLPEIRIGWESRNWPATEGQVIHSEITSKTDADEEKIFTFNMLYQYEVAGKRYQNSVVAARNIRDRSMQDLSEWLQKYPPGGRCTVYYEPESPSNSILEPGMRGGSWFNLVFGALFFLFALWLIVMDLKESVFG